MNIKTMCCFLTLSLAASTAMASHIEGENSLESQREHVVKQYIFDLQQADYQGISDLFDQNGLVISTSQGKVKAKDFFYSFLKALGGTN